MIEPMLAVSAMAVPDIPENIIEAPIFARLKPPLMCPSKSLQKWTIRLVIPQAFIRLPATINPGILSKTKTSIPVYILSGMTTIGTSVTMRYNKEENPNENATGTPTKSRTKNEMNNTQIIPCLVLGFG